MKNYKARILTRSLSAMVLSVAFGGVAATQVIEKHPAKTAQGKTSQNLPYPTLKGSHDDSEFGVQLKQLVVVDTRVSSDMTSFADSVDLSRLGDLLQSASLRTHLQTFIGQPLSQKLMFDIRAAVTQHYRAINRPLVVVTVPPQELTNGRLQIDVLPFKLGEKKVETNGSAKVWTPSEYINRNMRVEEGDDIDSVALIDDINWLNLNPYRNANVIFEPGTKAGTTNLIIRTDEQKPWSIYSGYSNSGSRRDDRHRFFSGFNVANLPFTDAQLGYQFTGSSRSLAKGKVTGLDSQRGLVSHSGSFFLPLSYGNGWRHKINLNANYAQSFTPLITPFMQDNRTTSIYADYAVQLPRIGTLSAEVYGGVDFKHQKNDVYFSGVLSKSTKQDIANLIAGSRGQFVTPFGFIKKDSAMPGRASFDMRIIASPGGLTRDNVDEVFIETSGNPLARARYAYLYAELSHIAPLPKGYSLSHSLKAQIATNRLPAVEHFSLGGDQSLRGYLSNEHSGDSGISLQTTIYAPAFELFGAKKNVTDSLKPFAFLDLGRTGAIGAASMSLASIGAGFSYQFNKNTFLSAYYGYALLDGSQTKSGDGSASMRLTMRY